MSCWNEMGNHEFCSFFSLKNCLEGAAIPSFALPRHPAKGPVAYAKKIVFGRFFIKNVTVNEFSGEKSASKTMKNGENSTLSDHKVVEFMFKEVIAEIRSENDLTPESIKTLQFQTFINYNVKLFIEA
eukprot:sb/3475356/